MTKITFRCYAKPVDAKLPNGDPIGDHTWVSTDQKNVCWSSLGSHDEDYYCGARHWNSGAYKPPKGSKTLPKSGPDTVAAATCMGDPKRTTFMGIPSSAGIVYGVNGVCHEIANRTLYFSGATVKGAKGYTLTRAFYGTYGTTIPGFVYWIPALAPVALAIQAGILVEWGIRTQSCKKKAVEGPALGGLDATIAALHDEAFANPPADRRAAVELHLAEVEAILRDALGPKADAGRIEAAKDALRAQETRFSVPNTQFAAAPAPGAPISFDPEDLTMALNAAVKASLGDLAEALGAEHYQAAFGQAPDAFESFLNPDGFR